MHSSTFKTLLGFVGAVLKRRLRWRRAEAAVENVYNYLPIDGLFATSGQPSETEFRSIKSAGYQHVINLAPTSVLENAVVDERNILRDLGIEYTHIPVDFKAPTEADFVRFVEAVEGAPAGRIWIHCAANMRVSAFVYRYRCQQLAHDQASAKQDLQRIWEPVGVWRKFVMRRTNGVGGRGGSGQGG